ncbi:MAG: hypothetical protein DRO40_10330 [Thermoprotei archaeon]|nr:MAG: hypothetical protein DRO40_10330 [Thermoprotei archaeon]
MTLRRREAIVGLYTYPAFMWIVYMDDHKLLRDYSEDVEVDVTAAHTVYKEHIVLLLDYFTVTKWFSRKAMEIAEEFTVKRSPDIASTVCKAIEQGIVKTPYKVSPFRVASLYLEKMVVGSQFRGTVPNIVRYLAKRRHNGYMVLRRLIRQCC